MKARIKILVLLAISTFLFATTVSAQPVDWLVSEPLPLSQLELPYVSDTYFFANYSPSTAIVYINGKKTDISVPPFSFRWVSFYVASKTTIEARTNVPTNKGIEVKKLKSRKARTRYGHSYGWLFSF